MAHRDGDTSESGYDGEDSEAHDSYDGSKHPSTQSNSRSGQQPHNTNSFDNNSLRMTMTPTTRFLEQPVLLDVAKDAASTGTSASMPGRSVRRGDSGQDHGGLHGQHRPIVNEQLIQLHYETPSVLGMALAGAIGLVVGGILNKVTLSDTAHTWIGFLGWIFLSMLECLALPLIFTTVTICVAQLVAASKSYGILFRMGVMFTTSALLASCVGMLVSYAMSSTFERMSAPPVPLPSTLLSLQCPNEMYLTLSEKMCDGKQQQDASRFVAINVTGIVLQDTGDDVINQRVSYAAQIVEFMIMAFQENITSAFTHGQYLGIILFAMFIGAGLVVSQDYPESGLQHNNLFLVLKQLDVVLEMLLNWLIRWIPLGTLSAMTNTIMTGTITGTAFKQAMYLPIALLVALMANFLLVVCVGYYILVRKNPFRFFWYLLPSLVYMLASQRYMATIPVMWRSIESSKQVSRTLAQFTVSLGTALSMCGHACFFVVACVFMAYTSGLESKLTPGRIILLIIVSALSSFGTPQTPGASLTYVATIWRTVFGGPPPDSFGFVVSMEWLTVRMRRVHNITVVAFIARVIGEHLDETPDDDEDREAMAAEDLGERKNSGMMSPL